MEPFQGQKSQPYSAVPYGREETMFFSIWICHRLIRGICSLPQPNALIPKTHEKTCLLNLPGNWIHTSWSKSKLKPCWAILSLPHWRDIPANGQLILLMSKIPEGFSGKEPVFNYPLPHRYRTQNFWAGKNLRDHQTSLPHLIFHVGTEAQRGKVTSLRLLSHVVAHWTHDQVPHS